MNEEKTILTLHTRLDELAEQASIDEIRCISAEDFAPADIFAGRQPRNYLPEAASIILTAIYIGNCYLDGWYEGTHARTSRLVLSSFYANIVDPMQPMAEAIRAAGYSAIICGSDDNDVRIPLKMAAVRSGLGWVGKNSLIVSKKYGTWMALGAILTNAPLAKKYEQAQNRCGSCSACMQKCPVQAVTEPAHLNLNLCISNMLEEQETPDTIFEADPEYFLECDICQEACPWNKKHIHHPLKTAWGDQFEEHKTALNELFRYGTIELTNESEYSEKVYPWLHGSGLSYTLFRRNLDKMLQKRTI